LERQLLERTLLLDWREFQRHGVGTFVSRIHKDALEGFPPMLQLVLRFVGQALSALVFLGVLLYLSWKATLALLVIVPPLVWIGNRIGKRVQKATSEERDREARYLHLLTETLKAFRLLRVLDRLRPLAFAAHTQGLRAYLDSTYENHRLLTLQQTWSDVYMNLANTVSLIVAGYYVFIRELTFGGFLAFVNAFWRAVTTSFSLVQSVPEFHRYTEIFTRLIELLSARPILYVRPSPTPIVQLRSVCLSYGGKPVLDISQLEIRPGERVLLVGPNGAGKTSLLHILSGYMAPDCGEVALPARIASLTSPVELPPLPIKDLITDPVLLRAFDLEPFREHTADSLSSGQRQKAAIGAVLSQEADLYLLDEPFANLDEESKEKVMDQISSKTRGKALIVVLHVHGEPELSRHFDRVIQLTGTAPASLKETNGFTPCAKSGNEGRRGV
jgi:ATP-binding cassette subfamily B protein